jgi:hypothetical protein
VVADCILTHSQLTDREKAEFARTYIDIEDIDSLDIESMRPSRSLLRWGVVD